MPVALTSTVRRKYIFNSSIVDPFVFKEVLESYTFSFRRPKFHIQKSIKIKVILNFQDFS